MRKYLLSFLLVLITSLGFSVNDPAHKRSVITAGIIDAINDASITVISSNVATTIPGSVITNDTLNGLAVTTTTTNVTPISVGPLSVDASGVIMLAANTPSGTYTITYQLCEADIVTGLNLVPANCDTATATIIVANVIDAVNDPVITLPSSAIATIIPGPVIINDTFNGLAVNNGNTNVTPITNGPLSINANGLITLAANTPSGTYSVTYQLCEADTVTGLDVSPANCDTATVTVIVANVIDAVNDPAVTVAPSTAATIVPGTVISNDTLNGFVVTTTNTNVTPITSGPLSVSANGIITVAANTPSGTYTVTYQLCEADSITGLNAVPANCDTATATVIVYSVAISVSTTTYTVPQLVQDVLFGSSIGGGGACAGAITNITWSTGSNFGGPNGIGSFTNTNPNFPLSSGVILTSGSVPDAPGPNNTTQSNGANAWLGDTQLFNYIDGLGIDGGLITYRNASILEFDFVPLTNTMSFDFLFASEEYGAFQCTFSDAFAFFLTNVTAGTPATNLALIPSTTTPVSVVTIRNNLYNIGCGSVNPAFFDKFYLLPDGLDPVNAPINFNGHTVKMTASSSVIPNNTYHIKLVVADRNDTLLDSAVFLGGGSFNIGQANISGATFADNNTTEFTIANGGALCDQSTKTVRAGASPIAGVTYQWTLNGANIPGATNYTYTITQPGTFGVVITFPSGCQQTDTMLVEYLPAMPINSPVNLVQCPGIPFNLSVNTPTVLGTFVPSDITYYTSLADATGGFVNVISGTDLTSFTPTAPLPQQIWIRVDDNTSCVNIQSFFIDEQSCVVPDLILCDDISNNQIENFDLTPQTAIALALGSYSPANYTVTYHYSQTDADSGNNQISPITSVPNSVSNPQTVFIRIEQNSNPAIYTTTSFQLVVNPLVAPTFNPIAAICSGDTLNPLPTTSLNSVTGTWSPALNNNATTTYTFTPNAGQCAITASSTIVVNPTPNATVTGGTSVLQNSGPPSISFTGSSGTAPYTFTYNVNGGANQTITTTVGNSVSVLVPTTTAGTYNVNLVSVQDSNIPACLRLIAQTAAVVVIPIPSATITGSTTVCQNATPPNVVFTGLNGTAPYVFTYTINGGPNQVTPPSVGNSFSLPVPTNFTGNFVYDLVSVQDANSTQPQTGTVTISVISAPVITTPTPYQVCDDNNDGLSSLFFLHTKDSEIGPATLTYEYYETLPNAQLGAPVNIITQNPYSSIVTNTQTLYVRVYDPAAPTCFSITTLQLIVNPRPSINAAVTDYRLCDVTAPAGDGRELFTLNSKSTEIANGQSLSSFTINYYLTQADAIAYTTSPTLPNLYQNVTPNLQTIWYNISNNATGCNSVGSFNLVVNPLPQVVAPPPMFECSNGVVMTAAFDLNLNNNTISPTGGTAVTYHLSLAEANLGINDLAIPYTNATNPQTVWVRVESTTTGCFDTTSLQLNVTQGPVANTPSPLQICDPNNDGFGVFNLNLATAQIVGATPTPAGVSVSYHETQTDAETGANAITGPYSNITAWSQIIYVRVFYTLTNCANYVQLKLNVNPTPIATDPADYHLCDDNYDGVVSFNLTSINPQVLNNLDPATHNVTYHTSLLDAQNDANPITNIASYQSGNTTLWIRVEIIATGCYDVVDFQLVVDPLPLSTQPAYPPYNLCDVNFPPQYEQFNLQSQVANILLGQTGMSVTFYPSLGEANAQINAITNTTAYVNVPPVVQTLGVVITNSATGCYVVSTMDIRVEPLPTPIAPLQPYVVCDANQDGFAQFDLCTLTPAINTGGYIITYHETLADAQAGNNPLPCIYQNIFAFTQIIWVGAEDTLTGCRNTMPIVLQVDPSPIMPTTIPNITLCDEDANNQDGITQVDLEQQTAAILAVQTSPGSNYTVTYYTSQANATSGPGNEIVASSTYQGSDNQVIWVRIEHNTTGCFTIGSFTLEINIPLQLTTPAPLSVCDNDANPNDLHTTFNLTVKNNQITNNLPGYIVTYYPSYGDALAGTNVITTPTGYVNVPPAVQTLGVMVTSAEGCRSYTTLNIRVLPVPTPNTNPQQLAAQCENALDSGVQTFDITTNAAYIINGDPNVTLHYYHSLSDATSVPPINEILNPTAALIGNPALLATNPRALNLIQNVYVVVSSNLFVDYNAQNCYTVVAQPFIINPLPVVVPIGAQTICEDDPLGVNDGFEVFDLTSYIPQLIAGNATQPTSNYNVTFYTDAALTNQISSPSAYTNVTNPQLIYAQVTNTTTGCSNSGAFDIIVNPKPDLAAPNDFATCDDELNDNDGFYQYPLDILITGILNGQSPTDYTVSFYNTSQADADSGTNAIANLPTYQAQTQTIWIRVENNLTGCYQIGSFDIIIEQYAAPIIETVDNINTICVNFITNVVERELTLFASNTTVYLNTPVVPQPGYDYQWYVDGNIIPGAIAPGYTINTPLANNTSAVFTVVMTSTSALGCSTTSQSFTVLQSGPAVPLAGTVGYTVTDAFSDNQIITVTVDGWGSPNYQYSLDDGPRQDSPIFENVSLGSHLITVWDTKGGLNSSCDALFIQYVATIDYPHYFTPNGDGIHDTWNIVGLDGQPSTKIYIFDRFGKLLKQISSTGEGWDGTFNGEPLPSTDYWFTVDYTEQNTQKQFKAHFSLKR